MRVLHIYNDWRWNGPAENIIGICTQLSKNYAYKNTLLLPRCPKGSLYDKSIVGQLKKRKLIGEDNLLEIREGFFSSTNLFFILVHKLRNLIVREKISVVTLHYRKIKDLFTLLLIWLSCITSTRRSFKQCPIVMINHSALPLITKYFSMFLSTFLQKLIDCYITFSQSGFKKDVNIMSEKTNYLPPAIPICILTTNQYGTAKKNKLCISIGNKKLYITKSGTYPEVIGGIVSRIQEHRRFDVLLSALCMLKAKLPDFKFFVIGRGSRRNIIVDEPIKELGLENNVFVTGYLSGDTYYKMLSFLDFGVFLKPGSDGTARTVREFMALGKPVIVSDYGILPEIIVNNETGFIVKFGDPIDLFSALFNFYTNKELVERFGKSAKYYCENNFDLNKQVSKLNEMYIRVSSKFCIDYTQSTFFF